MIVIINCCGSNIASIQYAFQRIGVETILTVDPKVINAADKVILPGVGHAKSAMQKLYDNNLVEVIQNLTQPVLGICLGMQLLYEHTEEGNVDCLGVIAGTIMKVPKADGLTVPHMGWNTLAHTNKEDIFNNLTAKNAYVYFAHSYYAPIGAPSIAETCHGVKFSSMVKHKNFYGMQFHPEKSGEIGEELLINFIRD